MWYGAPGGIRTPDLLIRSPRPAEAVSLPHFLLSRAVQNGLGWGEIRVSIELKVPDESGAHACCDESQMPSPSSRV